MHADTPRRDTTDRDSPRHDSTKTERAPVRQDPAQLRADVRITPADWARLREHLLGSEHEQAAILVCGIHQAETRTTFLVRDVIALGVEDYLHRGSLHLSIAPARLARYAKHARLAGLTVILCHSHPFPGQVAASSIDLKTESDLCGRALPNRLTSPTAALIVGPDSLDGRVWTTAGASALQTVRVVGATVDVHTVRSHGIVKNPDCFATAPPAAPAAQDGVSDGVSSEEATARQTLLWGAAGQAALRHAKVAVIGCGGTGSHIVTQLAHLGIGTLTLIDPDRIETSNLSRLIGAGATDVGRAKVDALAAAVHRINPHAHVDTVELSVLDIDPRTYIDADVLMCATDGHGSRALLIEAAMQYLLPLVDLGVEVDPTDDTFRAGGGVRVIRPDSGCLLCAHTLAPHLIREEYLDDEQRAREAGLGYIRGATVPAPSVVALNGVVASLAVLEICQLLVGMLGSGRSRLLYRAETRGLTTAALPSKTDCHVCGTPGIRGLGDARPLPTRWRPAVTDDDQALP